MLGMMLLGTNTIRRPLSACFVSLLLALLLLPLPYAIGFSQETSAQEITARIRLDFAPVISTVSQVSGKKILLMLPTGAVVQSGDIFAVYGKDYGENPEDGTSVIGLLRIVSVTGHKATGSLIRAAKQVSVGSVAVRSQGLRAALYLRDRPVAPIFSTGHLTEILPYIHWLSPHQAIMPVLDSASMKALGIDLLFRFQDDNSLSVYDSDFNIIRRYMNASALIPPGINRSGAGKKIMAPGVAGKEVQPGVRPFIHLSQGRLIGRLPVKVLKVEVADLDGDGADEIIYLLSDRLVVAPFMRSGKAIPYPIADYLDPYNFSLMPGRCGIALNLMLDGAGLASDMLCYENREIRPCSKGINLWLAYHDSDGDGRADQLLGQTFSRNRFAGDDIFLIEAPAGHSHHFCRTNFADSLVYGGTVDFPPGFTVVNSTSLIFEPGRGADLIFVSAQGFLKVFKAAGILEWSSLFSVVTRDDRRGVSDALLTAIPANEVGGNMPMVLYKGRPAGYAHGREWLCALSLQANKQNGFATYYAMDPEELPDGEITGIQVVDHELLISITRKRSKVDESLSGYITELYMFDTL